MHSVSQGQGGPVRHANLWYERHRLQELLLPRAKELYRQEAQQADCKPLKDSRDVRVSCNNSQLRKCLFIFVIGPLQLEVTWYKIQNIREQKNVQDSKTKHN